MSTVAEVEAMFRDKMTGQHGGDRRSEKVIKADNISVEPKHGNSRARRAAKQRRWRQRQAAGVAVYSIPIANDVLDKLIAVGLLGESESDHAHEVVKAVLDLVDDYLKARGV